MTRFAGKHLTRLTLAAASLALAACATTATGSATPEPVASSAAPATDPVEARIDALLAAMSVEQKVGQIIMPDISAITPEDARRYGFGTILNGGTAVHD